MAIDEQRAFFDVLAQEISMPCVKLGGILAQGIVFLSVTFLEIGVVDALTDVFHRVICQSFRITKEPAHRENDGRHPFCTWFRGSEKGVCVEIRPFLHTSGDVTLPCVDRNDGARMRDVE